MVSGKNRSNVILLSLLTLALLPALYLSLPIRASSPTLLVSEVLYDAVGTEPDKEWIEIYNAGASAIDLSNYKVGDEETPGGFSEIEKQEREITARFSEAWSAFLQTWEAG